MSKNNNWKQTDNEKLWGSAGLTDDFLLVPKELFRRRRDLDLTLADVYFILAVQSLRREGLDPYSNLIGLDPKTITKVKKHLRALGLMEDESSKPNPKHEFRVIPRYYFQGLCN